MRVVSAQAAKPWRTLPVAAFLLGAALTVATRSDAQNIRPIQSAIAHLSPLPVHVGGRVEPSPDGMLLRQWPGTYFETAFRGTSALFRVGKGAVSLRITVDGGTPIALVKPAPGLYRIGGLLAGVHQLRVQVASESQDGPSEFGGFFAPAGVSPAPVAKRQREIEFIGDSHTVGYGNTSPKHECTGDEIWRTTDTTAGVPAVTARRYDADYQVNAISGRGVVRNYNGFAADTLPQAYPYVLFDKATPYADSTWHPQLIVISLGTNDFSTPLNAGEKWANRDQLRSDYEDTFVRFVTGLRARNPHARFLLWAANPSDELSSEIRKVVAKLKAGGETRVNFVPVSGLAMSACNWHPSVADDAAIAAALISDIDAHPDLWAGGRRGERG